MGAFLFPPLLEFLFSYYGYFGSMLIMGALMFNNVCIGAVYRPLPFLVAKKQTETPEKAFLYRRVCNSLQEHLDIMLWRDAVFVCFGTGLALNTMSYVGLQMLIADAAIVQGMEKVQAVMLLSSVGISDTIGRVVTGFIFDIRCIRPVRGFLYAVALAAIGVTAFVLAVSRSFQLSLFLCILHGLACGAIGQRSIMGLAKLPSAFSQTLFLQGVALLVGPAFAGDNNY